MPQDAAYTIVDLSRLTGLNVRTIRYYLAQGLIPASGESGPGAHYGAGHLDRLRLIKLLQTQYLPNAEIRRRLSALSDGEVATLVAGGAAQPTAPDTTALEYVRNVLGQGGARAAQEVMPIRAYAASPPPAPPTARTAQTAQAADAPGLPSPARLLRRMVAPQRMPAMRDPAEPQTLVEPQRLAEPTDSYARMGIGNPAGQAPAGEPAPTGEPAPVGEPAQPPRPERSQWERLPLGENIELHIRRPLSRLEQRRVERLITIARQVLDEENAP